MENSVAENEAQQSFKSPPRRRRSTFFERRDSLVVQPTSENIDRNVCRNINETEQKEHPELKRYYETLLGEKEQWKTEVNNRRNKYHDIKQQYQMAAKAPSRSRISYSALSNEDIEFLKAKVNISKVVDSQTKLHKSVKETLALYRRAMELDNVILNDCEDKVNKITKHILDNSTIEPIE
ncbi:unnamed protein product [Danaus chrysippus]|uniref:(African queen) hypothetical protein n=1 Tax=Danaus chrysippus TaxID=151541 RepID=A0A8J2R0P1_9NEOP|nr:unnamed protein product [Danaus chrysippus]